MSTELQQAEAEWSAAKRAQAERGDALSDARAGHAEAWVLRARREAKEAASLRAAPDLRAIVRAEMIRQHGREEGAQAALARRLAEPWGVSPDSAKRQLNRWLQGGSMTADHFAAVLHALGGRIVFEP